MARPPCPLMTISPALFRSAIASAVHVFVLVIIVLVGVSRRQDVAHDEGEAPVEHGEGLGDGLGRVVSATP